MNSPNPELIKQTRLDAGLSAREAAEMIYCTTNAWQKWESTGSDSRNMHPAMWELFKIKLAQCKGGQK